MEFQELVAKNRARLRRLADLRISPAIRGRVDASDIVQEACIDALRHFDAYREDPRVSPYLWLRFFLCQRIIRQHRIHVKTKSRDATREVSIDRPVGPVAESSILAIQLLAEGDSPSGIVARREQSQRLVAALDSMEEIDREVIALRNIEQISAQETADLLGITKEAAYKRHTRALLRLKQSIQDNA